jgi:hypothetical protein
MALGVERGEERRAQAVLGEDIPSNSRIARIVLVGGEKEAANPGDPGAASCRDQGCQIKIKINDRIKISVVATDAKKNY